jgi:hypothetical protein
METETGRLTFQLFTVMVRLNRTIALNVVLMRMAWPSRVMTVLRIGPPRDVPNVMVEPVMFHAWPGHTPQVPLVALAAASPVRLGAAYHDGDRNERP